MKIFEGLDRDESHRELEKSLNGSWKDAWGKEYFCPQYKLAECREELCLSGPNKGKVLYQVWDGPDTPSAPEVATVEVKAMLPAEAMHMFSQKDLETLAELVAAKLKG